MGDQAQAVFQRAFRSGLAQAYNLSPQSEVINDPELFYSTFQQNVAIWNPNIPIDARSGFPGADKVVWYFPLTDVELRHNLRNLTHLCVSSPFNSFGRAISCLTIPYVSSGLAGAPSSDLILAAKYGVYRDAATIASNITRTFASYLSNMNSMRPMCATQILIRNDTILDLQRVAECMRDICKSASGSLTISPDIIGIGVWTAYFIQVGICFVVPILSVLFRRQIKRSVPPSRLGSPSSQRGETATQKGLQQKPSGYRLKSLQAAFTTSLVDFQKAQCYYIMAIQAASLITLHRTRAEDIVAQRQATSTVVSVVATLSTVAPTVILLCLCILEQRSWYILLLTVLTSTLSIYVFFDPMIMSIPDRFFIKPNSKVSSYTITDPYALCSIKLSKNKPIWHGLSTPWAIYLCGLILAFITVDHILNLRLPRAKDRPYFLPYSRVQRNLERFVAYLHKRRQTALINPGRRGVYNLAKLFMLTGVFATCFYVLGQVISSLYSYYAAMSVSHDWSFGQIVSVAIWVPVVVEWFQLSFRGMESGSEYRIPHPFRVTQVGPSTATATATSSDVVDDDTTASEDANGTELEHQAFLGFSGGSRRTATAEF